MAVSYDLKAFINSHERKLQAKVDAATQGRELTLHRRLSSDGFAEPLDGVTLQKIVRRPFAEQHGRPDLPGRYVLTTHR